MASVDVVGVLRTRPMLSCCARTEFAFVLRDGVLVDGSVADCGVGHVDRKALDLRGRGS